MLIHALVILPRLYMTMLGVVLVLGHPIRVKMSMSVSIIRFPEQTVHIFQGPPVCLGIQKPNDLHSTSWSGPFYLCKQGSRDDVGGLSYRNTGEVDDHEEKVDAAAETGVTNGPDLRREDTPDGATRGGEVEASGSHVGGEDLGFVDEKGILTRTGGGKGEE